MKRLALAVLLLALAPAPASATVPGNEEIFQTIREITSHGPRRVGTPGGRFAVEYVRDKMRGYGLTGVHVEQTPTYGWEALRHRLTVAGQEIPSSPVSYSQSPSRTAEGTTETPPGGLDAPIVDIGTATPAEVRAHDVKGKIVVFDLKFLLPTAGLAPFMEFLWDPEQTMALSPQTMIGANPYITTFTDAVKAAMDAGAVGFVGVLADYFDSDRYYNEFYRKLVVTIPGLWVTKKQGARLRALMAAQPDPRAKLDFATRRFKAKANVVVGFLEGRSKDAVMVQSHHDSGYTGAVEDGSGVAEVLALAKHYGAQGAGRRAKTLMFTTFDSHWSGYHAHAAFAKRHLLDRDPSRDPHRIVANVTLEHIAKAGLVGPDGQLQISDLPEPRGVFENVSPTVKTSMIGAIVRNDLRRTALLNGSVFQPVGIPTDASFAVMAGVPTLSLIAGPVYLYDAADTLDKVLKDELQPVAQAFTEVIDDMDDLPSDQLGAVHPAVAQPLGRAIIENAGGERGTLESQDEVEEQPASRAAPPRACVEGRRGRPVNAVRLRGRLLTFRARRTTRIRIAAGRRVLVRRVRACRRYRVRLRRSVRTVVIKDRRGTTRARRPA